MKPIKNNQIENHRFKKKWGQNFLNDRGFLNSILNKTELTSIHKVIEIGAGQGLMTYLISQKVNEVHSWEIDPNLYNHVTKKYHHQKNLFFHHDNALKVDYLNFIKKHDENIKWKIIGNLPYNIASNLIFNFLKINEYIDTMLFCLQEEFALRLVANKQQNKSYGALSVITQNHFNLKIIKKINKKMFYPVPKVNSAFVYFFNNKNLKFNLKYNKFIKILFQFKRKTLYNNLLPHINDKEQLQNIFQQYNFSSKTRINDLNIEQIKKLYEILIDKKIIIFEKNY